MGNIPIPQGIPKQSRIALNKELYKQGKKYCPSCKKSKLFSEFYRSKSESCGLCSSCKICQKIATKKLPGYNKKQPSSKIRQKNLKSKHNMTVEDYDKKLDEQKGVCAICDKKETSKNQWGIMRLSVDHNHLTNKNRGLLCVRCNLAMGQLEIDKYNIDLLLKAVEYVRKYNG